MASPLLVPVLIAGGGIAYVASQSTQKAPALPGRPLTLAPRAGATIQQAQQQQSSQSPQGASSGFVKILPAGGYVPGTEITWGAGPITTIPSPTVLAPQGWHVQSGWGLNANKIDPTVQEKLDQAEAYLKEQWENGNEVAKGIAADKLNEEYKLDPPLTGHESWGDMLAVIAGAAATAGCAAYPVTTIAAPLCGIVAAWLGKKFGDWFEGEWPKIKAWVQARWDSVEGAAQDAYAWAADIF